MLGWACTLKSHVPVLWADRRIGSTKWVMSNNQLRNHLCCLLQLAFEGGDALIIVNCQGDLLAAPLEDDVPGGSHGIQIYKVVDE